MQISGKTLEQVKILKFDLALDWFLQTKTQ